MNVKSSGISIDTNGLRNNAIPTASSTNTNIAKARNCLNKVTINMPKNFTKKTELIGVINRLALVEKNVEEIIKYINQKIKDFEVAEKRAQNLASNLNWSLSYQGGGIPSGGYGGYGTLITDPQKALEQMKKAGVLVVPTMYSTLLNLEIAASKGLVQLGENIADGALSSLAEDASVINWMFGSLIDKKQMEKMQKATMSFVSKDYTNNLYNYLNNNRLSKIINDFSLIKNDSNISNFVTNITNGGALFKVAEKAGPYGLIASATLGFLKGKGESTQAYWSQSDVKSMIDKGDNISNIFKKGTIYSDIKGLWSATSTAFQFATGAGGKVDSVLNSPWKRVMADSAMGGADVLIDTITGVVVDKKNIQQAFRDAGGFETMGYKALTAGTISSIGELARWGFGKAGSKKNDTKTIKEPIIDNTKEPIVKYSSKDEDILSGEIEVGMPLNLQFFANKQKEYMSLQDIEEIKRMYGITDDMTRAETNELLKKAGRLINSGELDGNQNFYNYMMDNIKSEGNQFGEYANYDTLMKRLTVKEAQSINLYTEGSTKVQEFLGEMVLDDNKYRQGLMTKEQMIDYINTLDSALEKGADLKVNQIFNRGMTWEQMEKWGFSEYSSLKASEGTTIDCKNYISTGVTKEGSFSDSEVLWRIKCDAGKNYGAYINEISKFSNNTNEYEFLMKRGAKIRIDNVDRMDLLIDNPKHGITYVDATVLGFEPAKIDKNSSVKRIEVPKDSILIE